MLGVLFLQCGTLFAQTISNTSFETPSVGSGNSQTNPSGGSWNFQNNSGITGNGSSLNSANPNAPLGSQVAFIGGTSQFSQTVSSLTIGTTYTVTFAAAIRNAAYPAQTWDVRIDGVTRQSYNPGSSATAYTDYTATFTATSTSHSLSFNSTLLNGGNVVEVMVFIDNVRVTGPGGSAPATPTGLSATMINNTQINLAWTDASSNETGFKIERKTGAGGTWSQIGTTAANVATFQNTGLATATQYYYRVRANNGSGDSPYSNEANATTASGPPPAVPSGLSATAVSASQINLSWTDNSNNENIFKVQRKTGAGGTWSQIGISLTNQNTFQNTGLAAGTQYYYRVLSNNTNGDSAPSNEANATTIGGGGTGTGLRGDYFANMTLSGSPTLTRTDATVNFSWGASPGGSVPGDQFSARWTGQVEAQYSQTYTFYTMSDDGVRLWVNGTQLVNNWTDHGPTENSGTIALTAGQKYNITLEFYENGGGAESRLSWSSSSQAKQIVPSTRLYPAAGPVAPANPSSLSATAVSSSQINLSWTDNSSVETGFEIDRKTGSGGTWSQIATTGANVTTYQNTGLAALTQYYYRVRATNAAGDSGNSNEANATTQSSGGAPNGTGLRGDYYSNMNLTGSPGLTRTDATVNFNWPGSPGGSIPSDGFSVRWTGEVQPQYSETYTFYSGSDDGSRLWVNGVQLVSDWFNHPYQEHSGIVSLAAGQKYNITYEYYENAGGAEAQLSWSSASQPKQIIPQVRLYPAAGSPPPGANFYQIIAKYWDGYGGNFASTYVYVPDSIDPNNTAPMVNSVTASPNSIGAGGTVNLSATATDANGDPLQYFWVVPAGHIGWTRTANDTWKAPTVAGTYSLQVMVSDGKVWSSGTVNVVVNSQGNNVSPGNHIASMTSIQASKTTVAPGETISLTVTQTDRDPHPNGDFNYAWVASGGSLNTAELQTNTNNWTAPSSPSNPSGRLVKPGFILWPRQAPDQATCPFPLSTSIVGVGLTGRASRQHFSDTWMPSWGADDKLISPWQDGGLSTPPFNTLPPNNPSDNRNGWAILEGSDPMDLMTTSAGVFDRISVPFGNNCYPGAVFTKDNVIYYGLRNFRLTNSSGALVKWEDGFQRLAPTRFLGFHTSTDNGQTWNRTTHTESNPLFNEPDPAHVKFGQIYMVDFGKNQQHSPDGKVYFVSNGSLSSDPTVDPLNEDGVYLCRVTPSVANINNASSWEFYGNGTWSSSIANATPIAAWENHFNGATVVYNPGLNKFLMTCYKGEYSTPTPTTVHLEDDDTFILEADSLTGPWRMVMYWNSFGAQAYYANIPSKFISGDGKTAWLWYGANFELGVKPEDPFGSGYRLTQQQIRFLTPADLQ